MYVKDDPSASYKLFAQEFKKRGYSVSEAIIDDRLTITYTSPAGKVWRTNAASIIYPFTTEEMRLLARNKEIAYTFAEAQNVSVPFTLHLSRGGEIQSAEAKSLFSKYPILIVKPSDSSLARGLTLNIKKYDDLKKAIAHARKISSSILIQEQVEGEEIRFALINGKVVSALLRRTPQVIGDGVSTIAQLIERENEERAQLVFEHVSYPQLTADMIDPVLFSSTKIPGKEEIVELSRATMIRNGSSMYDVLEQVHPSYIDKVEELGARLSTKFVVIDVCLKNFQVPLKDDNYWFIEFNTLPALRLFYGCRDGKMFDIIPKLTDCIDHYLHHEKIENRITLGSFEPVCFPDLGGEIMTAKVDTGAYSGALYATHVRQKKDEKDRKYIEFYLLGNKASKQILYDYYKRDVRSAHGHVNSRYVVKLNIQLKGKVYETEIGLSDRSDMKFPVLIGRKFLREHNMIVDVIVNEELDYEKENLG